MSGAADPVTRLEEAIGPVARTFTELRTQIANSTFTEQWKSDGTWATGVLADALREDWLGRFQAKSGPYLKFVLAPHRLPQLASTVEFAVRLQQLTGSAGLTGVLQQMRTQLEPGVMGHASLQLEVASLEQRRSGTVTMEADRGPGQWKPDVLLSHAGTAIGVECLRLSVADDVASHLGTPGGPEKAVDGWRRIGAKIIVKAGQPAQAGGWLRCELDDGMFADVPWFRSALSAMSLADKAVTLAEGAHQAMQTTGSIHGIVLSSPPASGMTGQDETYRLPEGCMALRRGLPGGRTRETFIIPSDHAADSEREMWTELYDHEPTWLDWALPAAKAQKTG
jgi:hypothetical protein